MPESRTCLTRVIRIEPVEPGWSARLSRSHLGRGAIGGGSCFRRKHSTSAHSTDRGGVD